MKMCAAGQFGNNTSPLLVNRLISDYVGKNKSVPANGSGSILLEYLCEPSRATLQSLQLLEVLPRRNIADVRLCEVGSRIAARVPISGLFPSKAPTGVEPVYQVLQTCA